MGEELLEGLKVPGEDHVKTKQADVQQVISETLSQLQACLVIKKKNNCENQVLLHGLCIYIPLNLGFCS
jgi:hypothetical protein